MIRLSWARQDGLRFGADQLPLSDAAKVVGSRQGTLTVDLAGLPANRCHAILKGPNIQFLLLPAH